MRAELVQQVTVSRYAAFAEMAWLEGRPELGELCRHGRQAGGRLSPAVVQQVLPGLADKGAENIVRRCTELELCDATGSLTGLGEYVADTYQAPVPEQGVYDIWAVFHPLLGTRMLHVERLTPTRDSRFDFESVVQLPVLPKLGKVFTSVVDSRQSFLLRALPSNHGETGGVKRSTRATCTIRWTLDWDREESTFRLDGFIDTGSGKRSIEHAPEPVEVDLWRVAADWRLGPLADHGDWREGDRRLAVGFDGLAETEWGSFTRDVNLGDAEVAGFGRWRDVRLSSVPIGPLTTSNATSWAMARLDRRLRDGAGRYTPAVVRRLFAEETEETPLDSYAPVLPAYDELLDRYQEEPEIFWRLAASDDLAPSLIAEQERGPMTIGVAPVVTDTLDENTSVVRLPYRGGWSMRMLLDRLTGGALVRRLLLVDRYVRGHDNLTALKLLVATVNWQDAPKVQVWTGDDTDADDLAKIHHITGTPLRRYREVFGRSSRPHDRYLVVVPAQGVPFGWQMSNSPLDARPDPGAEPTPLTPLRWRDLSAIRLPIWQLQDQMAVWAGEEGR